MARIRTIKPEFFTSETLARVPKAARLTFIGLWTYADDNGVGHDNERLIAAALYPLEEDFAHELKMLGSDLRILEREGVIQRYSIANKRFFFITNWDEHQKISHPAKPRYFRPASGPGNPPGERPAVSFDRAPETLRQPSGDSPETLPGQFSGPMSDERLISGTHSGHSGGDIRGVEETAGQDALWRCSGDAPEMLRPEQGTGKGTGNREQGVASPDAPTQPPLLTVVPSQSLAPLAPIEGKVIQGEVIPSPLKAVAKRTRKTAAPKQPDPLGDIAQELTVAFFERHKGRNAQPFPAIRGVVKTALERDVPSEIIAVAMDNIAKEGWGISGNTLTKELNRMWNAANGGDQGNADDLGGDAHLNRYLARAAARKARGA